MPEQTDRLLVDTIVGAENKSGRVLNLPTGNGLLTRKLDEAGVEIVGADLFPQLSKWKPEEVVKADMNEPLPFEDNSFDTVVCQEGIEHLEDVACFLRECRRILRSGGTLLVTTPNFMDLSSRLSFFLMGSKSFHGELPNEEGSLWGHRDGQYFHGHAFTLTFFQIRYLMRLNQFDDIELWSLKDSGTSRILSWLMRPLIGFFLRGSMIRRSRREAKKGKPAASRELIDELVRYSASVELLRAKRICIRARLREGSFTPGKSVKVP